MTLLFEFHGWKGVSIAGGSLIAVATIGFVTFGFAPFLITQKLAELTASLRSIVK